MKFFIYPFLFLIILSACKKEVPQDNSSSNLSDNILFLLKKTDSLSNALSMNISSVSKVSNKIDSLNNQLKIIQLEIAGLQNQLQNSNADVSFLTKKLDSLIEQYNNILDTIYLLFFEIASSPGSISNGLELYLPFNKNANNITSNKINTIVYGASLTKDRFQEPNAAYQFNGTTDYIQTNYNGILGDAHRTLAFWAKFENTLNNFYTGMAAVSWGPGTDGHRFDGYFNFNGWGPTANIGGSAITYQTPSSINDNTWHHYVYLIDSDNPKVNNIKVYQDGILLTNRLAEYDLTLKVNTKEGDPLKIGKASAPKDPSYFKGAIDEVRVYNRALSISEIKYLATH